MLTTFLSRKRLWLVVFLNVSLLINLGCQAQNARVTITPGENPDIEGTLEIFNEGSSMIRIRGFVSGLSPGLHGFHIHEIGDLRRKCKNAGGHFNPDESVHGDRSDSVRHVGDLGNIEADSSGFALIDIVDWKPSLDVTSEYNILGRAIVVHAGEDNLGFPGDPESLKTGRAGARSGCGLIEYARENDIKKILDHPIKHRNPVKAVVKIIAGSSLNVAGRIELRETLDGVHITGIVTGLSPGSHGFHIHTLGKLGNECKNSAGHFNPFAVNHGSPVSEERHTGDLGNIVADLDGTAYIDIYDTRASLLENSEAYIGGRSFVIHAGEDNFGEPGDEESLKTGKAGARSGCGIIEIVSGGPRSQATLAQATVEIVTGNSQSITGTINFEEIGAGMRITGTVTGLAPGLHGFHIHQNGQLGNQCKDAGGHFNPFKVNHAGPGYAVRHVGDLGHIQANGNGTAHVDIFDTRSTLNPECLAYVGDLAIVIHEGYDNFGLPGDPESLRTGRAGGREGCGIISVRHQKIYDHASVNIGPGSNPNINGEINIVKTRSGVRISGQVSGLTPGLHGFHIHQRGDLGNQCKNAGGHFNPLGATHGGRLHEVRHVGDLGNILADSNGAATIDIEDTHPSMDSNSKSFIGDLAIVIHAGEDNLGEPGDEESLKTGRAGARSGCGVIKMSKPKPKLIYERAVVNLIPGSNQNISGNIKILRTDSGVLLRGRVSGLKPGFHGFHIHAKGRLGNQCKDAGGHFNPFEVPHAGPDDAVGHVGDLGNIFANDNGDADVLIENSRPSMDEMSMAFIGDLAIVVHAGEDNLGVPGDAESLKTGRAGSRSGCGLIKMETPYPQPVYQEATCNFIPGSNPDLRGGVKIHRTKFGVSLTGHVSGLSPGLHGFHIHRRGDLGNQCKASGGHFNPFEVSHGGPISDVRHVGDLGNIEADQNGNAIINIDDSMPSMDQTSMAYIGDLAIVIHAREDNFGIPGDEESLKTGRAGSRSGCGLIRMEPPPIEERSRYARVEIVPGSNPDISGMLLIDETEQGIYISGEVHGLSPGVHGFHIHTVGDLGAECTLAEGHFNPFGEPHGPPDAPTVLQRHLGDLGNIFADSDGVADLDILDTKLTFNQDSLAFIGDLAIVVHAGVDNFGLPGDEESLKTGRAGSRSGCGLISKTFAGAEAKILPGSNPHISGTLQLIETLAGMKISGRLSGLTPSPHGFHIHQYGKLGNQCKDAGGHFNPLNMTHGSPVDATRHVGDLGNIYADNTGTAYVDIFDAASSIDPNIPEVKFRPYIGDRAIVIHAEMDNLGAPGDPESLRTGRAGVRSGCGLIEVIPEMQPLDRGYFNEAFVEFFEGSVPETYGRIFLKTLPDSTVQITGDVNHLNPFSLQGFHVHERGQLGNQCKDAGGHFNPYRVSHGAPTDAVRHVGDLGNIQTDEHGTAFLDFTDHLISLDPSAKEFIGDLAIVVHAGEDNLGVPRDEESLKTGRAGARAGCGLVKFPDATVNFQHYPWSPRAEGMIRIWKLEWGVLIKVSLVGLEPGIHNLKVYDIQSPGYECNEQDTSKLKHCFDFGFFNVEEHQKYGNKEYQSIERDASLDPTSKFFIGDKTIIISKEDRLPLTNHSISCGVVRTHGHTQLKDSTPVKNPNERIFFPGELRKDRVMRSIKQLPHYPYTK